MKFFDSDSLEDDKSVVLVRYGNEVVPLARVNFAGGVCDCCRDFETSGLEVVGVVKLGELLEFSR